MSDAVNDKLEVRPTGDANFYMITKPKNWFMHVQCNGERTTIQQEADMARMVACWNAFDGIPTEHFQGKSLEEYVTTQAYLNNLTPTHSGVDIGLSGLAAQLLASSFAGQFVGTGATNFLEINMGHPAIGDFSVTIQKTSGLTPAAMKAQAEKERDEALAINAELLTVLDALTHYADTCELLLRKSNYEGKADTLRFHVLNAKGVLDKALDQAIAKAKGGAA